ncbi:MAG: hypothetical protein AAF990_25745 [Bacteroidota bacterium]
MKRFLFLAATCLFVFLLPDLKAQDREWEFEKMQKRNEQKKQESDSILVHLKNKWDIKLTYGRWHFASNAKSKTEELFTLPRSMGFWQLVGSWHFSEKLSVDISIGFQLTKDVPTPNIGDLLNGGDVEIEGSGGLFLPFDLGLKYYFAKERFRPLVGFGVGSVSANFQYTLAEGNLSSGFSRTDNRLRSRAALGKFFAGFDYRSGKHTILCVNFSYYYSDAFKEPIGGYLRYQGFAVNAGFSVVF